MLQVGSLRVILSLEDFGPVDDLDDTRHANSEASSRAAYQEAWELEMWRREQEAKYEAKWRKMEQARLRDLETEWKSHELVIHLVPMRKRVCGRWDHTLMCSFVLRTQFYLPPPIIAPGANICTETKGDDLLREKAQECNV